MSMLKIERDIRTMNEQRRTVLVVDHMQSCKIIDQQTGRTRTKSIKFLKDVSKILYNLGGCDSRIELCLSRAGGNNRLNTTLPCNGRTAEKYYKASDGASRIEFGSMGSIETSKELVVCHGWECRKIGVILKILERNVRIVTICDGVTSSYKNMSRKVKLWRRFTCTRGKRQKMRYCDG